MVKIRRMEEGELEKVAEIAHREIWSDISFKEFLEWMRGWGSYPHAQHFVAEKEGEIVGCISWITYDIYGKEIVLECAALAVKEKHQGKTVGGRLIKESLNQVRKSWIARGKKVVGILADTDFSLGVVQKFNKLFQSPYKMVIPNAWPGAKDGKVFYYKVLRDN